MAANNQTVVVVVQKTWFNHAMLALTAVPESRSEGDAHVMICTVDDLADHRGLWIKGVTSRFTKKGGPFIKMRVMIPWQFVFSVGIVDESVKIPTGFANTTVLTADTR